MKRLSFTLVVLLVCNVLMSATISRRTAQQKASALMGKSVMMNLVATDGNEQPAYYIFNAQRESKGFVIVAGEEIDDAILAFSADGQIDPDQMPPAMQYLLQCYAEQIALVRQGQAESHRTDVQRDNIEPLITSKWDQKQPFNARNPINPVTQELFPLVGCVATAMAQVVRYWASPVPTQSIPSYTYYLKNDGSGYSTQSKSGYFAFTVDGLPSTTFNFNVMQDSYVEDATGESADEVAKLMAYCGRAASMSYTNKAGSANTSVLPLVQYFGYNTHAKEEYRTDYTATQWDQLVYDELKAGRPVIYSGKAQSSQSMSGHSFICDGYKDGLFHINWGWSGKYNAYFKLSEANPYGTGSGGSQSRDGYSLNQSVLTGVQPNEVATRPDLIWMRTNRLEATQSNVTRTSANTNFQLPIIYSIFNATSDQNTFDCGYLIYNQAGEIVGNMEYISNRTWEPNYGLKDRTYTVEWGAGCPDGVYTLVLVSRESNADEWNHNLYSYIRYLTLTVSGNTLTVSHECLRVNSVTFEGYKKVNKTITARASITNIGVQNATQVYLFVDGLLSTGAGVNIDPRATDDVLLHFASAEQGEHQLAIYGEIDSSNLPVGKALWTGSITLTQDSDPLLSVSSATISNMKISTRTITGTTFRALIPVTNNADVAFDDELNIRISRITQLVVEGSSEQWSGTIVERKSVPITIAAHATETMDISFDNLTVGEKYWMTVTCLIPSTNTDKKLYSTHYYTIEAAPDGIHTTTVTPWQSVVPMYNLNGQRIAQPQRGIYIRNGRKYVGK